MGDGTDPGLGQPSASEVYDEIRAIIRAAERLAGTIRENAERDAAETLRRAEAEARRLLEQASREAEEIVAAQRRHDARAERVLELSAASSQELVAVRRARQGLDEALDSMETAVARLGGAAAETAEESGAGEADAPPRRIPSAQDGSVARPRDETVQGQPHRPEEVVRGWTGARLVAQQMAMAGSTRAEAAAHLRRTFELPALHEVLDEVFEGRDGEPLPRESPPTT